MPSLPSVVEFSLYTYRNVVIIIYMYRSFNWEFEMTKNETIQNPQQQNQVSEVSDLVAQIGVRWCVLVEFSQTHPTPKATESFLWHHWREDTVSRWEDHP